MTAGINVFSEIGKLNRVLLHRPGRELEALTPATMERLLFDDIPYLRVAQEEHDVFANILRDNGAEVIYYVDECAKALKSQEIKKKFINEFLDMSMITAKGMRDNLVGYLMALEPAALVDKLICGIRRDEVPSNGISSLMNLVHDDYPYLSDPMLNLYFTRDPGACVGNGINVHNMHTQERKRESILLKYIYKYNDDFAAPGDKLWYDLGGDYSIEGGDVLVLSEDVVAVGLSQRTTAAGIEHFARNILAESDFKKILAFDIPKTRAFMHLDTVFTMVDYDKFTVHPEIEGPLGVYEVTLKADGELNFKVISGALDEILAKELRLPAVDLLRCGGGDMLAAQREQWNDGSNTLCIAPGVVVTYERNYISNDMMDRHGLKVLTMPSSELSRGRGGPRCMSCPVHRDNL